MGADMEQADSGVGSTIVFGILPHLLELDVDLVSYCLDIRWSDQWCPSAPSNEDKIPKDLSESLLLSTDHLEVRPMSVLPVLVTMQDQPCPITLRVSGLAYLLMLL